MASRTVVGVDLSLTATGVATIAGVAHGVEVGTGTVKSVAEIDDLLRRDQRLARIVELVMRHVQQDNALTELVVLEGPAYSRNVGSVWDRAGLWWRLVNTLHQLGIPTAVAAPTLVKKFAAGKGSADKAAVAAGLTRLWPDVEPSNDNEFDALSLATIGAQRLGWDVPTRAHHAECLTKVAWPAGLPTPHYEEPMRA